MSINIAIDGPAGAGKSTIAKLVAKRLGFVYVDTGAMYRAMGLYMDRNSVDLEDEGSLIKHCENVDITVKYEMDSQQIYLNGENITGELRTEHAGKMASLVSKYIPIREKLVELQKKLASTENVVMDGRDIGTVVLPRADLKVYLTASVEVRAKRRFEELSQKGVESNLEQIAKDIEERDYQDMHREHSPLVQAEDAILLDSSDMTIEEVADSIIRLLDQGKAGK